MQINGICIIYMEKAYQKSASVNANMCPRCHLGAPTPLGHPRGDDLEGLIKSQLTLPSSVVTSVVTSTIITTRLEGPQIQLTRCLLTGCTAVNFDYEEIADPVPDRKYLQVNTVPYT